jgi:tetratricopeptide (TPR) repeat protein
MHSEAVQPSVTLNIRAILSAILFVAIGVLVFAVVRGRYERGAIPTVTRGPLKPETPPLTTDKVRLWAALKVQRFDELEAMLNPLQEQTERDIAQEANVAFAFETFASADPALDSIFAQWVKQFPRSYSAHLAWATYLFAQGWNTRANKYSNEISQQQLARTRLFFTRGIGEAQTALMLKPLLPQPYALLLQERWADQGIRSCLQEGAIALARIPASFVIRAEIMRCLQPRWGGSYPAMERFAQNSQAFAPRNARLAALKGYPDLDRGRAFIENGRYGPGVASFTRAIEKGGDAAVFYRGRGVAFLWVGRYEDAAEDLRRADQLWPQSPDTLLNLAFALNAAHKSHEALKELNLLVQVGGSDPEEQKLRISILIEQKRKGKTTPPGNG